VVIWNILWSFGIFCGHLVYFVVIWYILWSFGIFCGHLVYFVVIWDILWSFGIFCGHLVYFVVIWYIFPTFWGKIWQPWFLMPIFYVSAFSGCSQPEFCGRAGLSKLGKQFFLLTLSVLQLPLILQNLGHSEQTHALQWRKSVFF
jgi:hypothetical protein